MTKLGSILKSRDVSLLTKVCLIEAMVFPIVITDVDHQESRVPKN